MQVHSSRVVLTERVQASDVSERGRVSGDRGGGFSGAEAGQAAAGGGEASGDSPTGPAHQASTPAESGG